MGSSINFELTSESKKISSENIRLRNKVLQSFQDDKDYLKMKNLRNATKRRLQTIRGAQNSQDQDESSDDSSVNPVVIMPIIFALMAFVPIWICWVKLCCTYDYKQGKSSLRCKQCSEEAVCKKKTPLHIHDESLYQKASKKGLVGEANLDIVRFYAMNVQASSLIQISAMANQLAMGNQFQSPYQNQQQMYMGTNSGIEMQGQGMMSNRRAQDVFYQPNPTLTQGQHFNNTTLQTNGNHTMTDDSLIQPHSVRQDSTMDSGVYREKRVRKRKQNLNNSNLPLNQNESQSQRRRH